MIEKQGEGETKEVRSREKRVRGKRLEAIKEGQNRRSIKREKNNVGREKGKKKIMKK